MVGIKVKHRFYGIGTVEEISNGFATVAFASKTSKFPYPDVFENMLQAEDPNVQQALLDLIQKNKEEAEQQRLEAEAARKAQDAANKVNAKFGANYNAQHLAHQPIYTYQQVQNLFGIKIEGFGRGINVTSDKVVLISSVEESGGAFVYHDRWTVDGDYIYSGEGKTGNQKMTKGNLAIKDAAQNGKEIHLFVKFSPEEYYYQGIFELVDYTREDDKDESGNLRKEYKFRLKKV